MREDLSGVGMWGDRRDVMKRLDDVLEQLDRGLDDLKQHNPSPEIDHIPQDKVQYSEVKRVLVEVDGEATKGPACKPPRLIFFDPLTPIDAYRILLGFYAFYLSHACNLSGALATISTNCLVCARARTQSFRSPALSPLALDISNVHVRKLLRPS